MPTVVLEKASEPGVTDKDAGVTAFPLRLTTAGLAGSDDTMASWAVRVPPLLPVGLKPTGTVQLAPAASVLPQVLPVGRLKSPLLVPETAGAPRVSGAPPVFLSVTLRVVALVPMVVAGKATEAGLTDNAPGTRPVPSSVEDNVPPCVLARTVSDPVRSPVPPGLKVTWIVQFAPAASDAPQLLVCV